MISQTFDITVICQSQISQCQRSQMPGFRSRTVLLPLEQGLMGFFCLFLSIGKWNRHWGLIIKLADYCALQYLRRCYMFIACVGTGKRFPLRINTGLNKARTTAPSSEVHYTSLLQTLLIGALKQLYIFIFIIWSRLYSVPSFCDTFNYFKRKQQTLNWKVDRS